MEAVRGVSGPENIRLGAEPARHLLRLDLRGPETTRLPAVQITIAATG